MLNVSEGTVKAVLEKAQQQNPEDFAEDFLAQLRLENRELHHLTNEILGRFLVDLGTPQMDREEIQEVLSDDELLRGMVERYGEQMAMALSARVMAAALVGLIYKCVKAEFEAKELEG
jgi:hypothetical protein